MRIAVNTRFLLKDQLEGFGHYTHEVMSRMVHMHPADDFHFYFDRNFSQEFVYAQNVKASSLFPPARHPLLFYIWYQVALRRALHANTPDVFFSPDSFMPLGLRCPAVITVHDVAHQRYPEAISLAQRTYYASFIPRFMEVASSIITVSEFSKQEILKYYPIAKDKVTVVYNGIGMDYKPLSETEQIKVRAQYTQGHHYFLFVGAIHPRKNVARLIEAYSFFRNQVRTSIKLLIVGRKSWDYADVDRAIQTSPYRNDIVIAGYVPAPMLARVTASAHALCYVSLYEGFGLPVAEAMACGVPVIVSKESAPSEVAGDAGIPVDPLQIEQIALAMQRLTDDTILRSTLIRVGQQRSHLFSWDNAARNTYMILEKAAGIEKRKNQ